MLCTTMVQKKVNNADESANPRIEREASPAVMRVTSNHAGFARERDASEACDTRSDANKSRSGRLPVMSTLIDRKIGDGHQHGEAERGGDQDG
jgi:hypothetical protein